MKTGIGQSPEYAPTSRELALQRHMQAIRAAGEGASLRDFVSVELNDIYGKHTLLKAVQAFGATLKPAEIRLTSKLTGDVSVFDVERESGVYMGGLVAAHVELCKVDYLTRVKALVRRLNFTPDDPGLKSLSQGEFIELALIASYRGYPDDLKEFITSTAVAAFADAEGPIALSMEQDFVLGYAYLKQSLDYLRDVKLHQSQEQSGY